MQMALRIMLSLIHIYPEERLLLKYRYLKNESWEDISYELNVSYRTVHRIHASSLNNFVVPE